MLRALRAHPRTTAIFFAIALAIPALLVDRLVIPLQYHLPHENDYVRIWLRVSYLLPVISGALSVMLSPDTVSRAFRVRFAWIGPACVAVDIAVYLLGGILERSFKAAAILPMATAASLGAILTGIVLFEKAPKAIDWVVAVVTSLSAAVGVFQIAEAFGYSSFVGRWIVRGDEFFSEFTNNPIAWHRAEGLALNPNIFTPLAIVGLLWAVFGPQRGPSRWITVVASIVIAAVGQSRTTILAILVLAAFAVTIAFIERTKRPFSRRALALLAIAAVTTVLVIAVRSQLASPAPQVDSLDATEQFLTDPGSDSGVSTRLEMWVESVRAIEAQPQGYFQRFAEKVRPYPHPHNEALYRLLYAGPLWLLVFVTFIAWLFLWPRPALARWLGPAMAIALLVNSITESLAWMRPYTVLLFAMIGALMYMMATEATEV